MADLNIEMNVKTNTGYDQLYPKTKSNVVEYTPTANGKESLTSVKLALDSLLRGDYTTLEDGSNIFTYAVNKQESNTCQVVKIINSVSVPTNYGYNTTSNEFMFISIKKDARTIQLIAIDCKAYAIFGTVRVNGSGGEWTRINDGGNANQLGGVSRTSFMQNYPSGTGLTLTSATYTQPYTANISSAQATSIGLPANAWHLMYLPHTSAGNGCQIAYPLDSATQKPKYRMALGTTWQAWKSMGGSGAVISATAPADTESLWINSAGLMKYHNGTTWVAVKTNAVWG